MAARGWTEVFATVAVFAASGCFSEPDAPVGSNGGSSSSTSGSGSTSAPTGPGTTSTASTTETTTATTASATGSTSGVTTESSDTGSGTTAGEVDWDPKMQWTAVLDSDGLSAKSVRDLQPLPDTLLVGGRADVGGDSAAYVLVVNTTSGMVISSEFSATAMSAEINALAVSGNPPMLLGAGRWRASTNGADDQRALWTFELLNGLPQLATTQFFASGGEDEALFGAIPAPPEDYIVGGTSVLVGQSVGWVGRFDPGLVLRDEVTTGGSRASVVVNALVRGPANEFGAAVTTLTGAVQTSAIETYSLVPEFRRTAPVGSAGPGHAVHAIDYGTAGPALGTYLVVGSVSVTGEGLNFFIESFSADQLGSQWSFELDIDGSDDILTGVAWSPMDEYWYVCGTTRIDGDNQAWVGRFTAGGDFAGAFENGGIGVDEVQTCAVDRMNAGVLWIGGVTAIDEGRAGFVAQLGT